MQISFFPAIMATSLLEPVYLRAILGVVTVSYLLSLILYRQTVLPYAKHHRNEFIWVAGFGKPFVDSLPPYDESAEASSAANDES
jgi:hypothetical protein